MTMLYMTRKQAAEYTSLSPSTLERMRRVGKIQVIQLSDWRIGWPVSELEKIGKTPGRLEVTKPDKE